METPCNAQRFPIEMVTVERQSYGSFLSNSPCKADDVDRDLISLPFGRIPEPEEVVFTQVTDTMIPRSIRQFHSQSFEICDLRMQYVD